MNRIDYEALAHQAAINEMLSIEPAGPMTEMMQARIRSMLPAGAEWDVIRSVGLPPRIVITRYR